MMSAQFFVSVVTFVVVVHIILISCSYLIFLERKIAAWTQDRIGPNRVNFSFGLGDLWAKIPVVRDFMKYRHFGLGQALIDGLKLFLKEDYTPPHVDRALFILAPALAVIPAMISWAVIPWGGVINFPGLTYVPNAITLNVRGSDCPIPGVVPGIVSGGYTVVEAGTVLLSAAPVNIGIVYVLAVGSLAVYAVVVGGFASNNKYSFLGGLRATAQMLSYEVPMGLCVLIVLLCMGTMQPEAIVQLQATGGVKGVWNIFLHPLLAIIFFTCVLAECNRAPFDLAEAEQELVGGYHTEYSSMKWALFFLGEYMHMITGSAIFAVLFLGGWDVIPFVDDLPIVGGLLLGVVKFGVFVVKVLLLLALMMWVRWTLPRFRFDQLMRLAWRSLIPVTLAILLVTGVLVYLKLSPWFYLLGEAVVLGVTLILSTRLPQGPPVNRRVPLAGSRFSPLPK